MARATSTIKIGGDTLVIRQWGNRQGLALLVYATRLFGPMAGMIVKMAPDLKEGGAGVDIPTAVAGILEALRATNPDDLVHFVNALGEATTLKKPLLTASGAPAGVADLPFDWDDYFPSVGQDLAAWVLEGLRLNYASFFATGTPSPASPPAEK